MRLRFDRPNGRLVSDRLRSVCISILFPLHSPSELDMESANTSDREMVITRLIDAPRELVFKTFTDVEHVSKWWGPNGFTTTTYSMDVRPGGEWRYVMHGPDGRDYENRVFYLEITPPERLVYRHGGEEEVKGGVSFESTVTFVEQGGKTLVTLKGVFPTAAERNRVVEEYGAIEGGEQTLARLAQFVEQG